MRPKSISVLFTREIEIQFDFNASTEVPDMNLLEGEWISFDEVMRLWRIHD